MTVKNTAATEFEPGLISVIIPTYNRQELLVEALSSVRAQTYSPIQIIVVDDGSTDQTRAIVEKDPDIEYVYQSNQGQAVARNTGLALVRGEYICSLDSDDIWQPDFLARSLAALSRLDVDFVFSNWVAKDDTGTKSTNYFQERHDKWRSFETECPGWRIFQPQEVRSMYLEMCASPTSSILFRRQTVQKFGWTSGLHIADDWCLIMDIVINNNSRVAFTLEPLWLKRVNGDNICDQLDNNHYIQRLLIDDGIFMVNRFYEKLTKEERARAFGRIAFYSFVMAKRNLKGGNLPSSVKNSTSAVVNLFRGTVQNPTNIMLITRRFMTSINLLR